MFCVDLFSYKIRLESSQITSCSLEGRQKFFLYRVRSQQLSGRGSGKKCVDDRLTLLRLGRLARVILFGECFDSVGEEDGTFAFFDHEVCRC